MAITVAIKQTMQLISSDDRKPGQVDDDVAALLADISPPSLRQAVERISVPRPYGSEANRDVCAWLHAELAGMGYAVARQGRFDNLVARWPDDPEEPEILVGAHYDSVPGSPGADDNASAVAALLACARSLAGRRPRLAFALFNREEDDQLGSRDFVDGFLAEARWRLREVHILEMLGFCSHAGGSQRLPGGLPVKLRDTADFLGLIANRDSNHLLDPVIDGSRTYQPDFPIVGLKVHFGLEARVPVLLRSDHAPFWRRRIPAVMWTDTSEFRNPHYHQASDTPDTLDYEFLARVTRALVLRCLSMA
jgi:hypothetical protein